MARSTKPVETRVWITSCSYAPWMAQRTTVSVGPLPAPLGAGARKAVRRFGVALERLADA